VKEGERAGLASAEAEGERRGALAPWAGEESGPRGGRGGGVGLWLE